ncbi:hypothetical protein G3480_08160 [Thiorhodococcus mannitoliphagus]|uniref:Uncharacterized protein n=1 Tax=Thiorhodococcus mannitoliphagus TaxID=329406 RepID=A0A6P1DPT4_9GAMM|nr:hypothetical protein [Thiorhodococcus mannitoliphagus]NEX20287.1 hypothetical protein [Thiorhodococcus mannitoliphagus]
MSDRTLALDILRQIDEALGKIQARYAGRGIHPRPVRLERFERATVTDSFSASG